MKTSILTSQAHPTQSLRDLRVVVKDMLQDTKMNLNIVFGNIWETGTHNHRYQVQLVVKIRTLDMTML